MITCDWCRANFRVGDELYVVPRRAELYHSDCACFADLPVYNLHRFEPGKIVFEREVSIAELKNEEEGTRPNYRRRQRWR